MIEQIPEYTVREMYEDYVAEMKRIGEKPLEYLEWCRDEQIEPV
jgi:hypothetical protein